MSVILITLDALSARYMEIYGHDHFSPYFAEKAKTPNIQDLLRDSIKYNYAYTNSNMTIVACRELLEGRMVSLSWDEKKSASLPFSKTSLTNVLKENNITTGSILGSGQNWVFEGFISEFDYCLNTPMPFDWVTDKGIEWIDKNKNDNFFFWIHSKETHMGFNNLYIDAPFGKYDLDLWEEKFKDFVPEEHICLKDKDLVLTKNLMLAYARSISLCDHHLGRFIKYLKDNDIYDKCTLIISADHGSNYGDVQTKHYAQHSNVAENVFNIPLIIKYPNSKRGGTINNSLCQTIDIPYTILEQFGIKQPESWEGESLKDLKKNYVIMECNPFQNMFGVKTKDWLCQYILPQFYKEAAVELKYVTDSLFPFLFNVNDPTVNVYEKYPDIVNQIKEILRGTYAKFLEGKIK